MQKTVDASFDDVDAVLLVVDARAHIGAGDRFVARRVFGLEKPVVIAAEQGRPAEGLPRRLADEGRRRRSATSTPCTR